MVVENFAQSRIMTIPSLSMPIPSLSSLPTYHFQYSYSHFHSSFFPFLVLFFFLACAGGPMSSPRVLTEKFNRLRLLFKPFDIAATPEELVAHAARGKAKGA
jgi:hypothetical protein